MSKHTSSQGIDFHVDPEFFSDEAEHEAMREWEVSQGTATDWWASEVEAVGDEPPF